MPTDNADNDSTKPFYNPKMFAVVYLKKSYSPSNGIISLPNS